MTSPPLISVAITVYNRAKLLPRALDSVLEQRTAFPIEIIVSDDGSTDGSADVARSYQVKYPDLIHVIAHPSNVGIQRNYYGLFEQCRGKYTAWLDSDDYWTDPEKLTIQAQILESDPTINMCFHYVRYVSAEGEVKREKAPDRPAKDYSLKELVECNFVPTPTAVFRTGLHKQLSESYFSIGPISDWPIWILAARSGRVVLTDHIMADYMLTPDSAFAAKGSLFSFEKDADFYRAIMDVLPPEYHGLARDERRKRYNAMVYHRRIQGDLIGSRQAALNAFNSVAPLESVYEKTKVLGMSLLRETMWRLRRKPTKQQSG